MGTDEITSCVIHPGIGIARVGNSCTEYFIGPEVPWASPVPTGGYKDASGAVKRQAARFRIYGLNSAGEVVKEITAEDAQITWRVHVANSKAAWYHFNTALDIPEAQPTPRRNPAYAGPQRAKLIVDPGAREITGCGQSAAFDTGTFLEIAVPLGEIRTDDEGRLLVLGGFGGSIHSVAFESAEHIVRQRGVVRRRVGWPRECKGDTERSGWDVEPYTHRG